MTLAGIESFFDTVGKQYLELRLESVDEAERIPRNVFLGELEIDIWSAPMVDDLLLSIYGLVIQERLSAHRVPVMYKWPKSWWQHFKYQYFPEWLIKRFPVLYRHTEKTVLCELNAT